MGSPKRLLFLASKNKHKLEELQALLAGSAWDVRLASDLNPTIAWDEIGETFADNARIKAQAVKAHTKAAVLADDSGLEVAALGGAPGVRSARYAGRDGDDAANNAKLMAAMQGVAERSARFVCCLCFMDEEDRETIIHGACEGEIIAEPRGAHGFGYDPLFLVQGRRETMAELPPAAKNSLSHRSRAMAQWLERFKGNGAHG